MERFLKTEVNKKLGERAWKEFLSQIKNTRSLNNLEGIFNALLSSKEKFLLIRRLVVKFLLKQGKDIKKYLKFSAFLVRRSMRSRKVFLRSLIKHTEKGKFKMIFGKI